MAITHMDTAFRLDGKTAIVTGGNRGIGFGISTAFAQAGANVAILCRNEETAIAAVNELSSKYSGKFKFYKCDITDMALCKQAVDAVVEDFGGIDILVNNGGIAVGGATLDMDEELEMYFRCIDVDLNGTMRMSYLVGKHMAAAGKGGKVINISSNSGAIINKPQFFTPYHVAKAGVNHMTRSLANEWSQYGINVNAIAPGYTHSGLSDGMNDEIYNFLASKIPLGRFGDAIEVGALAVYLASPASDMVTGVVVTIDGGYSIPV